MIVVTQSKNAEVLFKTAQR